MHRNFATDPCGSERKHIVKVRQADRERYKREREKRRVSGKLWIENNKEKYKKYQKEYKRYKATGHTPQYFEEKFAEQGGKCAICKKDLHIDHSSTFADHCHKTGIPRGILCPRCNTGLGYIESGLLGKCLEYLRSYVPTSLEEYVDVDW